MTVSVLTPLAYAGGPGISLTEMEWLQLYRPAWPMDTPAAVVECWMFDEARPNEVYVYPPVVAGTAVEAVVEVEPVPCVSASSELFIADEYLPVLVDYVMARCLGMDIEGGSAPRAAAYWQAFWAKLGHKTAQELMTSPNTDDQGGAPSRRVR